jgi:hypothetical protein
MNYFQLRCADCFERKNDDHTFMALLSTEEHELLHVDWEECEKDAGVTNTDSLRNFHKRHEGHRLVTIPEDFKTWFNLESGKLLR